MIFDYMKKSVYIDSYGQDLNAMFRIFWGNVIQVIAFIF